MRDTCCAVACKNRNEITLKTFVNELKDRKISAKCSAKKVFFKNLFLNLKLFCICAQNPLKLPVREANFSNIAGLQHATLLLKIYSVTGISKGF